MKTRKRPANSTANSSSKDASALPPEADAAALSWPRDSRTMAYAAILLLLVLGVYVQTGWFEFVHFDDTHYVLAPEYMRDGLSADGISAAFTQTLVGNWHPLTTLSYLLDAQLWGIRPGPMHLVNVALHAANAVVLFLLLRRMTGRDVPSAVVAALLAVHPLHVESVAWIAERKDVLSMFFFLLTLFAYVDWTRRPAWWRYALIVLAYALGLMSKPMLVTLPFLLLLLDYWPLKRVDDGGEGELARGRTVRGKPRLKRLAGLTLEKLPLLAMALATSVVAFLVQRQAGAMALVDHLSLPERLANASEAYFRYLGAMVWPAKLSALYPIPPHISLARGAMAGLGVVAISIAAALSARRMPYLFAGWFWYVGTLVPVIGLVQVGSQSHADRYTYIPLIGIYVALVWTAAEWLGTQRRTTRLAAACLVAVLVVALAVRSAVQARVWRDGETLYRHALDVEPRNPQMHYNLATMLLEQGRNAEADPHFRAAIKDSPDMMQAWCNLALSLSAQGRFEEAKKVLKEAEKRAPNLADVVVVNAHVALQSGDLPDAARHAEEALRRDPRSFRAHFAAGNVYLAQGRLDEAAEHFQSALDHGGAFDSHRQLGIVRLRQSKPREAIASLERAMKWEARDPVTQEAMGQAVLAQGDGMKALAHFQAALDLNPNAKSARFQSARLLTQLGFPEEAIALLNKGVELDPRDAPARFQLGLLLQQQGDLAAAAEQYRLALVENPGSTARNNLAWIRATAADEKLRNGAEAVALAEEGVKRAGASAALLDTLAAAYAEAGRFDDAVRTARQALAMLKTAATQPAGVATSSDLALELGARLALYERAQPYREIATPATQSAGGT